MQKITKLRMSDIKKRRYEECLNRCVQLNSNAQKAGRAGSGTHALLLLKVVYEHRAIFFAELFEVERNALREKVFFVFVKQRGYFNRLASEMRELMQYEYKNLVASQFAFTTAYEANRYQNPLDEPAIRKQIEEDPKLHPQINC